MLKSGFRGEVGSSSLRVKSNTGEGRAKRVKESLIADLPFNEDGGSEMMGRKVFIGRKGWLVGPSNRGGKPDQLSIAARKKSKLGGGLRE